MQMKESPLGENDVLLCSWQLVLSVVCNIANMSESSVQTTV